jgi:signal transduction histidine kinase/ligand-binding sensor domain-containing protein
VEDGLPRNAVTAAVQTRDGYLWLGTYAGLVRFDGVRFVVFNDNNTPALKNNRITSLYEAADGTLWIGHETGDVTRFQAGQFAAVPVQAQWNSRKILSMGTDDAGEIWLLNPDGLVARLRDGIVLTPEAGSVSAVVEMATDRRGRLWVGRNGKVSALRHGQLHELPLELQSTNSYAQGICPARDGGLWVVTDNRIRKWDGTNWTEDRGPPAWGYGPLSSLVELRSGFLAAGTADQGLLLISPAGETLRFGRTNGLSHDWVRFLCEDREGNLWVGTGTGLNMLRPGNVTTVAPPDEWQGRAVLSVTPARDGSLWVGTEGAGVYCWREGAWSRFSYDNSGLSNPFVWSVVEDEVGQMWAGTWAGGIYVRRPNNFAAAPRLENFPLPAPALLPARGGGLWIGTSAGLLRYEAGGLTNYGSNVGLESPEVRSVTEARDGTVWFGMYGGGLGCLQDGQARQFRKRDGLASDFVQCLKLETNGTLWIGTFGGGLSRWKDGRFANVGVAQGLPNNVICHIEDDGRGYFWMSSYGGIFRVAKTELEDCADGKISTVRSLGYGTGDGLPTLECSGGMQPAGCRTADGRLWFPTSKGLVVLDPGNVTTNPLPPPVVIEEFRVDGRVVPNHGASPLPIAPGHQRFDFQYTALSFVSPERVRFRCRLAGLEENWVDMGSERSVNYNFVPPGDYTFHVVACNNDNVWNETGAQFAFQVLPYFWQTVWFRGAAIVGMVLAASGAVWFDTRRRMHRKLERLERQRALERERERIARDIHDDLGASLTHITMLSQVAHGATPELPRAVASLDQIFGTARELTRALDEIVWAVNPKHDTLESLAGYLGKFAEDYLRAAHQRCRLDVPMQLPAWVLASEVRHNLFLAVKEALHNVVKHARATEVRITLTLAKDGFAWEVADNGRGFGSGEASQPSPDRLASGNGLANMHRRLADLGGHCEVQSAPGAGTRVKFVVSVKAIES